MNVIQQIEAEHAAQLPGAKMPAFQPGDTVIVNVKVAEGERTRVQAYEGVCIARSGHGLNENFTVRKISYGEGVERVFPVYSPMIDSVKVVRRGKVRRAKLYYLRDRRGKSARIAERVDDPGAKAPPRRPPRNKLDTNLVFASKQGRRRSRRLFCLRSMTNERSEPDLGGASSEVVRRAGAGRGRHGLQLSRARSASKLEPGAFVRMPLGARVATGVVWAARAAGGDNLKPIAEVLDWPPLRPALRDFIDWTARWTLAPRGMLLRMAIRAGEIAAPPAPKFGLVADRQGARRA